MRHLLVPDLLFRGRDALLWAGGLLAGAARPARQADAIRRVLVVLGGRSGTSALAGTLGLLGAVLPRRLMAGNASNPKGHFEPQAIADQHDRLLAELGTDVSQVWRPLPASWFEGSLARRYERLLRRTFLAEYGRVGTCVLKEPRISQFLPLWLRIFAGLKIEPGFIVIHRHPMDVARSLRARDRTSLEQGLLLYIGGMLAIERATRGHPRLCLPMEALFEDWRACCERIQNELGLSLPGWDAASAERVNEFLDPSLRHHHGGAEGGDAVDQRSADLANEIYQQFCALSDDEADEAARARLDALSDEVEREAGRLASTR